MNRSEVPMRLLVIEDEEHLAAGLKLNFELEGYEVDVAGSAREAGELLLKAAPYDAMVLDVMLPDADGFTLCQKLRDAGNFTPVLMLTARDATVDRVTGLEAGADDYLTKPFELAELLARLRSLLRRRGWEQKTADAAGIRGELRFGDAVVNFDTHEASVAEVPIRLTHLEFSLLEYLASNSGRVVSRHELLAQVWNLRDHPNTRMVDNFIMRLRRHFEPDPAEPVFFLSVRGAGYRFVWSSEG